MNFLTIKNSAVTRYQQFKADPRAALTKIRYELAAAMFLTVFFLSNSGASAAGFLQEEPVERPTLALDVNEMLYWMFEGANIIIVALGAVVFLTIGFVLGRKILELIRSAISSL